MYERIDQVGKVGEGSLLVIEGVMDEVGKKRNILKVIYIVEYNRISVNLFFCW
jgi:hypothetical protein